MACTDKFTITKGVDNTFVFTIKQTGTTLPMEIVNNKINKELSIVPAVTYVPYQAEVAYVAPKAEVQASAGQVYIPTVVGKVEKYNVYANVLVDSTTYELQINSTTISVPYTKVAYPDKYEYLIALKNAINANATINTIVVAIVDENILQISGLVNGQSYTINGSDTFTITETQKAQTAVAGQPYIAPTEYSPAVVEVPYQAEVQPHYTADYTAIVVDLASIVSGLNIVKIEVQPEVTIADLKVGAVSKPLVNSWYDIGTATAFTVTPVTVTGKLSQPLPAILLRIRLTLTGTVDTFDAKLITLETGEIVLELGAVATANGSKLTIKNEASGKIELLLTEADIDGLIVDKGPKVDRYYARPSYKMVIECNTVNNGEFLATIPYVYVE